MSEQEAQPTDTTTQAPEPEHEKIGKVCVLCTDAEPFDVRTKATGWQDPGGESHWAHAGCFHRARADEQVKLLKSTQEVLACILASGGGTVNVSPGAIQRAIGAGFRFTQEERRGGGFRMRLGDNIPAEPATPAAAVPDMPPDTATVAAPEQTP